MRDYNTEIQDNHLQQNVSLSDSEETVTLMSILLAVLKRPWLLMGSLSIALVFLIYYYLNLGTVYESSSTVMVSVRESSFLSAVSLVEGSNSIVKSERYYTSILDSRAYKKDVTDRIIAMYPDLPRDSIASVVGTYVGYDINRRAPGFIMIKGASESREFAKILAETALETFKARSVVLEREDALHISIFINNQINSISEKLEQAEENLQAFLALKKLITVNSETGITQELFDLEQKHNFAKATLELVEINILSFNTQINGLLNQLKNDTKASDEQKSIQIKSRLAEIRTTLNNYESLDLTKDQIQELANERNKLRTELISLSAAKGSDVNSNVSTVGVTLQKLEEELEAALLKKIIYQNQVQFYKYQLDRFRIDHPNLSEDILLFASLSRAKEVLQKTLDILLEKREEIRIRVESEMGGIKVIDSPTLPGRPLSTNVFQKFLLGIFGALVLGITVSVVVDRFDNTIRDEGELQRLFGLPTFGTIPSLHTSRDRDYNPKSKEKEDGTASVKKESSIGDRLLCNFSQKSPIAEAYRSLKVALHFLATDRSKKMFVISSPSMSEGKSLSSANLSISFADGGSKTILIDCDLRKTVLHKYFELNRKPGLTNVLYGEVSLQDAIQKTKIDNLYLLPSGDSPANPAELLASQKMKNLLAELRDQFDFLLLDTPPILVCSDSRVLAEVSDGLIMIIKVESTNVKALSHAINLTTHLNIDILGFILNQVEFRYGRAYYYTYRYYRPYSYYSGYYYQNSYYYAESKTDGDTKTRKKRRERIGRRKSSKV